MKYLPLAIRNLLRNKRRSILTVLSIAVSVFVFASLISLPGLINEVLRDRANSVRLLSYSKAGLFYQLPQAYRRQIEAVRHVDAVSGYGFLLAVYRDPAVQIGAVAIDTDHVREIWPDWGVSADAEREFERSRIACLAPGTIMNRYRWKVGDQIILHGISAPVDLQMKIVGQLGDLAPQNVVVLRRDYLDETLGGPGTVNLFWIKMDHSRSAPQVIEDIDRMFANSAHETTTQTEAALIRDRVASLSLMVDGAKFLAAIVVFTIALVAANTAAMAVRERRHEIGVMRAIGFRRAAVVTGIVTEGVMIGVSAGVLGCALARLGFLLLPYAAHSLGPLAFALKISARVIAYSFAVALIIGAASALIPALLSTRGEISTELRAL